MQINQKGSSTIILVVVIVILILMIAGLLYYFLAFKGKGNGIKNDGDVTKQTELTQDATPIDPETLDYKEFTTTDGNLSIKYPSAWIKSEIGDVSILVGAELVNKYKMEIPLTATLAGQNKLASLSVLKMEIDESMTADELIDDLMNENMKLGLESEIINKQTSDNGKVTTFEAKYTQTQNNTKLRSKEKVLLTTPLIGSDIKGVAFVTFQTLEQNWQEYMKVGDHLLDSISLVGITDEN